MSQLWSRFQRRFKLVRKAPHGASGLRALAAIFALCCLLPDPRLEHPRVRFISKPLKISVSKTNPPRLAFEAALQIRRGPAPRFPAVVERPVSLNEVIGRGQMRPAVLALYYRHLELRPMVIGRAEVLRDVRAQSAPAAAPVAAPRLADGPDVPERRFEPTSAPRTPSVEETHYSADEAWFDSLSPRQQRLLQASGLRSADLREPLAPSLAESLAAKVEEELQRLQAGGTVITPAGASAARVPENATVKTEEDRQNDPRRQFKVAGHLFLDALTAFLPDHRIEVVWMREGVSRRTGRFSMNDSHFSIDVDELAGAVRLEMYDRTGSVVAAGGVRLSPELNAQSLTRLQVRMRPVGQVASNFTDFYKQPAELFALNRKDKVWSFGKNPIRTKASFDAGSVFEADPQGLLFIDGIAGGSSSFAMTESADYYPSLHLITSGQQEALPLISKKTAKAMLEIIEQQLGYTDAQKNGAIVMGQVTAGGRALSGAEVALEGFPEARPVYLNEVLIPDPRLKTTSGSGYFVFVHLPQGFYSVRAMRGPQFVGYGNVVNEPRAVSFIEVREPARYAPFDIRAFDAFSGAPQSAELALQSLNQTIRIEGYGQIEHPVLPQYTLLEANPATDEHVPAVYPYAGDAEFVHLPLIPRAWLDERIAAAKINLLPGTGAIMGFSEQGGYEISLPHLPAGAEAQVLYFDVHGRQVPAAVENGGFLLVNIPAGAQTVVLHHALGGVVSRVLNADAERLTVSKFVF